MLLFHPTLYLPTYLTCCFLLYIQFKLGQTVEVLKQFVETEYGIPMGDQRLWLDNHDQMMIDPLSLLDYPEAKGAEEIYIRVEGNLPADSKK